MNKSRTEQAEILREFSRGIGSVAIPATYTAEVAAALLTGAAALEAVEVAKAALDTFSRAYRVSMLPFAPGIDEADGAHHWMPHGWPSVADFKQAAAALARLEAL